MARPYCRQFALETCTDTLLLRKSASQTPDTASCLCAMPVLSIGQEIIILRQIASESAKNGIWASQNSAMRGAMFGNGNNWAFTNQLRRLLLYTVGYCHFEQSKKYRVIVGEIPFLDRLRRDTCSAHRNNKFLPYKILSSFSISKSKGVMTDQSQNVREGAA